MTPRRTWRETRIDALIAAVSDLGMSMSQAAAGELIDERVKFVASQMRVSTATAHGYLTDEAIKGLAQTLAFGFVEEIPGADLVSAPRDAAIPIRLAGRVGAGLAEAVRIRLAEREDLQHTREAVAHLAHAQGVRPDRRGPRGRAVGAYATRIAPPPGPLPRGRGQPGRRGRGRLRRGLR